MIWPSKSWVLVDAARSMTAGYSVVGADMVGRKVSAARTEEFLAHRPFLILALEASAALQLRYDKVDKIDVAPGRDDPVQIEAVDIRFIDPADHLIGHPVSRSDDRPVLVTKRLVSKELADSPGIGSLLHRVDERLHTL